MYCRSDIVGDDVDITRANNKARRDRNTRQLHDVRRWSMAVLSPADICRQAYYQSNLQLMRANQFRWWRRFLYYDEQNSREMAYISAVQLFGIRSACVSENQFKLARSNFCYEESTLFWSNLSADKYSSYFRISEVYFICVYTLHVFVRFGV